VKEIEPKGGNFVFSTLIFAHFAFALFSPFEGQNQNQNNNGRGKSKTKTHHFHFGFAPHGTKMIHYQELVGQKQNIKI
jgi:hypothetical protein